MHSILEPLHDRQILIAGATGFLGKVWLAQLLHFAPTTRVVLLVRERAGTRGCERVAALLRHSPAFRGLRRALGPDFEASMAARVRVLEADLTELDPHASAIPSHLLETIDLCVNLSGTIDFVADPTLAVAVNVRGAMVMAQLAERTASRRLIHASTCYVAGPGAETITETPRLRTPRGEALDVEAELARLDALGAAVDDPALRSKIGQARARALGWPNVYTFTKALAEAHLLARPRLRATVVRPAIVENAVDYPFPGWNEGFKTTSPLTYLMHSGLARVPAIAEHKLDLIPVDDVGRGLLMACARGREGEIWQLASSACNPLTNARFLDLTTLGAIEHGAPGGRDLIARNLPPRVHGGRDDSVLAPRRLRGVVRGLRRVVGLASPQASRWLGAIEHGLGRAATACELFEPFILEHDHTHEIERALAASRALPASEREALALRTPDLDWRRYLVDVYYPGQLRWCFPLAAGDTPPDDVHVGPPLRLVSVEEAAATRDEPAARVWGAP